jgi:hypothetical protein
MVRYLTTNGISSHYRGSCPFALRYRRANATFYEGIKVERRENTAGSELPDYLFHPGPGVQETADANRKPDRRTHPAKEDYLIGFAQGR